MQLSEQVLKDLDMRFNHHAPPNEAVAGLHGLVRQTLREAAASVLSCTPAGREQAVFLTKLEEAMFWANAAIARNPGLAAASQ